MPQISRAVLCLLTRAWSAAGLLCSDACNNAVETFVVTTSFFTMPLVTTEVVTTTFTGACIAAHARLGWPLVQQRLGQFQPADSVC